MKANVSDLKLSVDLVALPQGADKPKAQGAYNSSVERVGGYLYVIGNLYNNAKHPTTSPVIGLLDIRRSRWLAIPYPGHLIRAPRVFLFDDSLYVYARNDWKNDTSGRVSRFDMIEEDWSYCNTTGALPGFRPFGTGDYLEKHNRFVVFGGRGRDTNVRLLLMPECKWVVPAVKGKQPERRHHHGSCVYRDVIYYYGGWALTHRLNDGIFLLTFTRRDVATWSVVQSTVGSYIRLSSLEMFPWNGKIFLCGGRTLDGNLHGVCMYDLQTHEFESVVPETGQGYALGVGSRAFIIEHGHSFGLIGGQNDIWDYRVLSIMKNS